MANCKVNPTTGCWEWTGPLSTSKTYGQISVRVEGKHKTLRAHRVSAEIVLDRKLCPETETIEHACTNTLCILPNDFLLATASDNSKGMQARRWMKNIPTEMKPLWPADDDNCDVPLFGLRYWHSSEPIPF